MRCIKCPGCVGRGCQIIGKHTFWPTHGQCQSLQEFSGAFHCRTILSWTGTFFFFFSSCQRLVKTYLFWCLLYWEMGKFWRWIKNKTWQASKSLSPRVWPSYLILAIAWLEGGCGGSVWTRELCLTKTNFRLSRSLWFLTLALWVREWVSVYGAAQSVPKSKCSALLLHGPLLPAAFWCVPNSLKEEEKLGGLVRLLSHCRLLSSSIYSATHPFSFLFLLPWNWLVNWVWGFCWSPSISLSVNTCHWDKIIYAFRGKKVSFLDRVK